MPLALNHSRLQQLRKTPFRAPSPHELRRQGKVFFIGGNLPVFETLETMYASYCQESTDLFHVIFAGREELERNLELVRQIKKNFSVRLMGQIACEVPATLIEQAYLAGLDLLDLPYNALSGVEENAASAPADRLALFQHAAEIFPRWSLVSSLHPAIGTPAEVRETIDSLLAVGVVPLPAIISGSTATQLDVAAATFDYLIAAWQLHEVQIKPLLPLIRLVTPMESSEQAGFMRVMINRIQDRHLLVTSDLRRHLRTKGAEASFESAGL